uniref:Putative odorant-binding protein A10 n=1 Tax=Sipha flava TaxID=143950 RepID=A0A2S2Q663_9HEMI
MSPPRAMSFGRCNVSPVPELLLVIVAVCVIPAAVRCGESKTRSPVMTTSSGGYVTTYDHMDISRLLSNDKLVTAYIKCFLGEGPCTAECRQAKAFLLPDIINTVCARCSPRQKIMARQVMIHIYNTRRSDFDRIMQIYDTTGKYNEIIDFMNGKQ